MSEVFIGQYLEHQRVFRRFTQSVWFHWPPCFLTQRQGEPDDLHRWRFSSRGVARTSAFLLVALALDAFGKGMGCGIGGSGMPFLRR